MNLNQIRIAAEKALRDNHQWQYWSFFSFRIFILPAKSLFTSNRRIISPSLDRSERRTQPTFNLNCSNVFAFVNVNRWQTLGSAVSSIKSYPGNAFSKYSRTTFRFC